MKKKTVSKGEFILRRLLIIFGSLLTVGVILAATVKIVTIIGRNRLAGNANTEGPTLDAVIEEEAEKIYDPDWQEGWISYNGKVYEFNDKIRTFLIMGIDNAHTGGDPEFEELTKGGQADGLFLVILNPIDESIKILAVNRDTEVDILMVGIGDGGTDVIDKGQITIQHAFGGGGEYSCELTRDAVSRLFYDIPIHGYVAVNYQAVPIINDAVGGVTLTLPQEMEDVTSVNKAWTPGATVTLKGNDAYDFIHWRDTDVFESQRFRLARQKLYLKSFIKQMKAETKKDIMLPVNMYQGMKEYIVSDLTVDTISYMTSEYMGYSFDEDDIYTMEGETEYDEEFDMEYFHPDEEALRDLVISLFYREVDRK